MTVTRMRRTDSALLFHARYTDGVVDALTGQAATFTRAGTATFTDSNGNTGTAAHSRPRFEVDGGVPALWLEVADTESIFYTWPISPSREWSALTTMVAPAGPDTDRAFVIGGNNTPSVQVRLHGGTEFRAFHFNGASSVNSITSGLGVQAGDIVEGVARFFADGSMQVEASVNGGAVVSGAVTAALAPAASWQTERLYAGHAPTSGGISIIREIKLHPDPDLTMAQLRGA